MHCLSIQSPGLSFHFLSTLVQASFAAAQKSSFASSWSLSSDLSKFPSRPSFNRFPPEFSQFPAYVAILVISLLSRFGPFSSTLDCARALSTPWPRLSTNQIGSLLLQSTWHVWSPFVWLALQEAWPIATFHSHCSSHAKSYCLFWLHGWLSLTLSICSSALWSSYPWRWFASVSWRASYYSDVLFARGRSPPVFDSPSRVSARGSQKYQVCL